MDKTGTLTKNQLKLKKVHIDDSKYSIGDFSIEEISYLVLNICHSCILIDDFFEGESQEEIKILNYCREEGNIFVQKMEKNRIILNFKGSLMNLKIVKKNKFSSQRKMMSVVVEYEGK